MEGALWRCEGPKVTGSSCSDLQFWRRVAYPSLPGCGIAPAHACLCRRSRDAAAAETAEVERLHRGPVHINGPVEVRPRAHAGAAYPAERSARLYLLVPVH